VSKNKNHDCSWFQSCFRSWIDVGPAAGPRPDGQK
jgi:hypothetical protein